MDTKKYKKTNRYIKDYYLNKDGVIYVLKKSNNKCYKADELLKKIHDTITNWSNYANALSQFRSEYNELKYIYRVCKVDFPDSYILEAE